MTTYFLGLGKCTKFYSFTLTNVNLTFKINYCNCIIHSLKQSYACIYYIL